MGHGGWWSSASVMPAFVDVAWVLLLPGYNLSVLGGLGSLGQGEVLQSWRGLRVSGKAEQPEGWEVLKGSWWHLPGE